MVKNKIADVNECMLNGTWRPDYVDFLHLTTLCDDCGKRMSVKEIIEELDYSSVKMSPAVTELGKVLGVISTWNPSTRTFDEYGDEVDFYLATKLGEEICMGVVSIIKDMRDYGIPMTATMKEFARRCNIISRDD